MHTWSSGALSAVTSGGAKVRRGTQVGLARASNKGAVGAAFRLHRHTLAVVSAHLAADKKGRVHLERRLRDVCEVLHSNSIISVQSLAHARLRPAMHTRLSS